MKIVFICVKGMPIGGGIEKYTEELGSRLVQRGHEVVVYCSKSYGDCPPFYKGMRIRALPTINTRSLQKLSLSLLASVHQFFEQDVDIVHFHAVGPSMFCFLPRMVGRKTVVQSHGHEWKRAKWGLTGKTFFKLAEYAAVYLPDRVTAVSRELKRYYQQRYGVAVRYIPTGVELLPARAPALIKELGLQGKDYILFMARLVPEKGAHYLLEAFLRMDCGLKLVIAGDALHEERYKAKLTALAAGHPDVLFTGFVTGALQAELYSNARVFVLPSEIEGLPISLLEAMSYGVPCIVSDIPENIEALGDDGYTFASGDSSALQRCLTKVLATPVAYKAGDQFGQERVRQHFGWDCITDSFEALYLSLVSPRAMSRPKAACLADDRDSFP